MSTYKNLKISGPTSLLRGYDDPGSGTVEVVILLGQTGTGKSSFIEALGGGPAIGLSGDSLESVTQKVECYKVVNVEYHHLKELKPDPIYIIDCPGFGDNTLSAYRVIRMLQDFIKSTIPPWRASIRNMLYFHRISDKRVSGSQKRTLTIVKSLVGKSGGSIWTGVVTTMWDTLWRPEQLHDAESRFNELKREHLKNAFGPGADAAFKFDNTQESALHILNNVFHEASLMSFRDPPLQVYRTKKIRTGPFAIPVYEDLIDRVSALQQRIRVLENDIDKEMNQDEGELLSRLLQDKAEVERLLRSLEEDQKEFGRPPETPANKATISQRLITFFRERSFKVLIIESD